MTNQPLPTDYADMPSLRAAIDHLDKELVDLLCRRAALIDRAIELKQHNGWPARIPERVEEVVANARQSAEAKGLDQDFVELLWRQMVDWSIQREARVIREV